MNLCSSIYCFPSPVPPSPSGRGRGGDDLPSHTRLPSGVRRRQSCVHHGFTLIELMVTLAIFTVMTGMVLANYPDFNNKISRDLLVQEVALSIREAQVYGTSIRSDAPSVAGNISNVSNSFGMYFGDAVGNVRSYYLFTDRPEGSDPSTGDNIFLRSDINNCGQSAGVGAVTTECINTYTVNPGKNKILLTCGNYYYTDSNTGNKGTRTDCDKAAKEPGAGETLRQNLDKAYRLDNLNIVFKRPNPEAVITGSGVAGIPCGTYDYGAILSPTPDDGMGNTYCSYANAAIFIGDGVSQAKKVIIWNTGQIATE